MPLSFRNIFAFLLLITGSMALGSMYSGYINHPQVPVTAENAVLTLMMTLFIFSGFYTYNFLTRGKGRWIIALALNVLLFVLTALSFTQGYNTATQRWFSVHEVLNLMLTFILSVQLILIRVRQEK
ncbi:MAG: hypothetical protein NZM35_05265 [Chitinophagales bacterium]|nr:hypothetical protein [Chitinophagales bacterium]MDW8418521.1 hypothetical protein [Chitinophagales bacterium]